MAERDAYTAADWETGIPRRAAAKVLTGVPWKIILYQVCERHPFVTLKNLAMICACLDVVGAKPGVLDYDRHFLALLAAGHRYYLDWWAAKAEWELERDFLRLISRRGSAV